MERNAVDALKVLHDIDASNRRKSEDLGASRRDRGFWFVIIGAKKQTHYE